MPNQRTSAGFAGDPREGGRLRVVIATIAINVVAVGLLVFAPYGDLSWFDSMLVGDQREYLLL